MTYMDYSIVISIVIMAGVLVALITGFPLDLLIAATAIFVIPRAWPF